MNNNWLDLQIKLINRNEKNINDYIEEDRKAILKRSYFIANELQRFEEDMKDIPIYCECCNELVDYDYMDCENCNKAYCSSCSKELNYECSECTKIIIDEDEGEEIRFSQQLERVTYKFNYK